MSHLVLRCLGSFQATLDGQPITGFESGKVRALLAYLAIEADEPHSRDELIGLLWPDRPEAAARASLRQAVANLRESIGDRAAVPPFLIITSDTIQFNRHSSYWLDVTAFADQLQTCAGHAHRRLETCPSCAQRHQAAADLYRGDFLTRLYQNSEAFEEWALVVRERLRRAVLDALRHLTEYHARRAEYSEAQRYALRQIELDPWREEAHRQLMRALALSGQRSAALAQYDKCRRILADELDVEPSSETKDLAEQIKAGHFTPSPVPRSLPAPATPLIGRERELAEINRLMIHSACRVVTLLGPGGVGKTQLALHAAAAQISTFVDGVHYIALEALTSADALAAALALRLGLAVDVTGDPLAQLADYVAQREMLIVFDNFEQLLPAGAEVLATLIAQAPLTIFLVTSRERLNLREEWVIDVHGLSVPADDREIDLARHSAMQLFVSRVERLRGSASLSSEDWRHVARICRSLCGLPLALELAASRSYYCSFSEIADEIEQSLDSVATPLHDLPQRHRSLRTVFDQSWRLLSPAEREVVQALTVFRGSFDPAAAEWVAETTSLTLSALRDKSLLQPVRGIRFALDETMRHYAGEQRHSALAADRAGERHCAYYREQIALAETHLMGVDHAQWMSRLDTDRDNLRSALQWSLTVQPQAALEMAGELWTYWQRRGYLTEGRWWLEQVLKATEDLGCERARAKALAGAAYLACSQGDFEAARRWAEQSVLLWQVMADSRGRARALIVLGIAAGSLGDHAGAAAALEESISLCRAGDDHWGLATALFHLADSYDVIPMTATAKALLSESIATFESVGDGDGVAWATYGLGAWALRNSDYSVARAWLECALHEGQAIGDRCLIAQALGAQGEVARSAKQAAQAESLYAESRAMYREIGAWGREAMLLHDMGCFALEQNEAPRAAALFADSLNIFRQLGNQRGVAACLDGLAATGVGPSEYAGAMPLFGQANRLRSPVNTFTSPADQHAWEHYLSVEQSHLGVVEFSDA